LLVLLTGGYAAAQIARNEPSRLHGQGRSAVPAARGHTLLTG